MTYAKSSSSNTLIYILFYIIIDSVIIRIVPNCYQDPIIKKDCEWGAGKEIITNPPVQWILSIVCEDR